jgi:hypothetical protein
MKTRLIDWWRRRRWTSARYSRTVFYDRQEHLPSVLPRRAVAIIGSVERPKWAVFACPCGHGHNISINLSRRRLPYWTFEDEGRGPTMHPSIDAKDPERRCHFWVREGRVRWAIDAADSHEILPSHARQHQRGGTQHGT